MATIIQIDTNRRNAHNSLRNGLRARTVLLPGESRQEFEQLCDDLQAEWRPQTRTGLFYLEQMAVSQWKLARMEVGAANIQKKPAKAWTQLPLVDRFLQAQDRLERSYARAQRELERLQNSPEPEPAPQAAVAEPISTIERYRRAAA